MVELYILELRLQTKALKAQQDFYANTLGLKVTEQSDSHFAVQVGTTKLVFVQNKNLDTSQHVHDAPSQHVHDAPSQHVHDAPSQHVHDAPPKYHFAINIPENQIEAATSWLSKRCTLIHDSAGKSLFEFSNWNAHSIYFLDAAGNILELIARHELVHVSQTKFSSASFLNISEIGLATPNLPELRDWLCDKFGLETYRADRYAPGISFCPLGDANGLLILVAQTREWYPDTGVQAQVWPTEITMRGQAAAEHVAPNLPYRFKLLP